MVLVGLISGAWLLVWGWVAGCRWWLPVVFVLVRGWYNIGFVVISVFCCFGAVDGCGWC